MEREQPARRQSIGYGWVVLALAVVGLVVYLVTDHLPHLVGALPYAGLIAVTVAHLFMHGGHSHHGGGHPDGHDHREAGRQDPRP